MRKFAFLLLTTLVLSACGSSGTQAENAGKAMAETACLLFDQNVTFDQITEKTGDIMNNYGWDKPEDIDTYLASIQGTAEVDTVKSVATSQMESTCGDALTTAGVSAADLAASMVQTDTEAPAADTTSTENN